MNNGKKASRVYKAWACLVCSSKIQFKYPHRHSSHSKQRRENQMNDWIKWMVENSKNVEREGFLKYGLIMKYFKASSTFLTNIGQ